MARGKRKSGVSSRRSKTIGAKQVLDLLLHKHADDVAVPECKIGPTWNERGRTRRFDLWAMKKSWAHPCCWGYEIKVTRNDFLQDKKWMEYFPHCNSFSFVCPPGVIDKSEVPEEAGLIVTSANGTRLYTKKKAPYRNIETPVQLLIYVLMSRVKIERERLGKKGVDYWRAWLRKKEEARELGHMASRKIRELVDNKIQRVEKENKGLARQNEKLEEIKKFLEMNGIPLSTTWSAKGCIQEKLDEKKRGLSNDVIRALDNAVRAIQRVKSFFPMEEKQKKSL